MADKSIEPIPTLIIGLGGTGLKVATFVKKNLLEANQNQLPPQVGILVLDTVKTIDFQAGGWGNARDESHATGPVKIEGGEYRPLTGNVSGLITEIMNEQIEASADPSQLERQAHRHISSWFQAQYYRQEVGTGAAEENLDVGAARFRQFGRLALFKNISSVTQQTLPGALSGIRRAGANKVYVHVVGSLAGGTGASMFIDIPHLVRELARDNHFTQTPVVFGHFVLPAAFEGTEQVRLSDQRVREGFQAKSYAALRELTRLLGRTITLSDGYPLTYDPAGTGAMNTRVIESLYTVAYLYDGIRGNLDSTNDLNKLKMEDGLAPSIADVIVSYVDDKSGGAFVAQSVNYRSFYPEFKIPSAQVTYGSVGTYTIELPIYHITEGWTHELANEVIQVLGAQDPGGTSLDPTAEARRLLRQSTGLISQFADWGISRNQNSDLQQQIVDQVLGYDAAGWQQQMSALGEGLRSIVDQSLIELEGSLTDPKSSKYYVSPKPSGNTDAQKAENLKNAVESKLKQMVGMPEEHWRRQGGDFRKAMERLASYHRDTFRKALDDEIRLRLNGDANLGSAEIEKRGKLPYVMKFLQELDSVLKASYNVLAVADKQGRDKRKPIYDGLESDVTSADAKMRKSAGWMNRHLEEYLDKSNRLAQFHKADIARKVAQSLLEQLQVITEKALEETELWQRILLNAGMAEGGMHALIQQGQREVESDRSESRNASRWIIRDNEPGDSYISEYRAKYIEGQLRKILGKLKWNVGRRDDGALRIELQLGDKALDRLAGTKEMLGRGKANANLLLEECRVSFQKGWDEMSVAAYLERNFKGNEATLGNRIFENSGYLLSRTDVNELPPMRSTFMRVSQEHLTETQRKFLAHLRQSVSLAFKENVTNQIRSERVKDAQLPDESGEDSRDRFKLTFVMFGDLLEPAKIAGFANSQSSYRTVSGRGDEWKPLHILPAETNALEIERKLSAGPATTAQKRRELSEEVVTVLEDREGFRLAMHALAYGDTEYDWHVQGQRGLLLHKFTLSSGAQSRSFWRLALEPDPSQTIRHNDGSLRFWDGNYATPSYAQLTQVADEPDLLQAFIQLVCAGKAYDTKTQIERTQVAKTVQSVMENHRIEWAKRQAIWTINSQFKNDPQRILEVQDRAAQIIRLNTLIARADGELGKHRWAWAMAVNPPANMPNNVRTATQKYVDLWTAIRMMAKQEMDNLSKRFLELARWESGIPAERISLHTDVARGEAGESATEIGETTSPSVSMGWTCPKCGTQNSEDKKYCTNDGEPRPVVQPAPESLPNISPVTTSVSMSNTPTSAPPVSDPFSIEEEKLKWARDEEILTQEEYEKKIEDLNNRRRVAMGGNDRRAKLKRALEDGVLTQAEYDEKIRALEQVDPKIQERRAKLEQALRDKILSQEDFDRKIAELG